MSDPLAASAVRLYLFSGARRSAWKLLKCFGMLRIALPKMRGLEFSRALGCGQGIAFSVLPDWRRYAVLVVGHDDALDTFEQSAQMESLRREALSLETYDLLPVAGHGRWDGAEPFRATGEQAPDVPIAVITRARIPLRAVPAFISHSHQVTASLANAPGRIFSLGMGELPFIRQATFSVWNDTESMQAFAYGNARHREAVTATRRKKLFGEELFWRFAVRGYSKRPLS